MVINGIKLCCKSCMKKPYSLSEIYGPSYAK